MSGALLAAVAASIPAVVTVSGYQLWTWGNNTAGALGLGDTLSRSSPVQVGALTDWLTISNSGVYGRDRSLAIKLDGTLWAWGSNYSGILGLSTTIDKSSPVQVGALTTWLSTSAGGYATACIKTDGNLWTW